MENGYVIFNADGSKPKAIVAVLFNDEGYTTIVEGKSTEIITAFGILADALVNKKAVIQGDAIKSAVHLGIEMGDKFVVLNKMLEGFKPEDFDRIIETLEKSMGKKGEE